MVTMLGAAAAVCAAAAIGADWRGRRPALFYVLKPLTTLLIAGVALLAPQTAYRDLVLAALLLSLIGDICLMFESEAAFLGGLSSFLLAHGLFVAAFAQDLPALAPPAWTLLFVLYGAGFAALLLPRAGRLKLPVLVYGAALVAMALTAAMRHQAWPGTGTLLALAGAVLFVISDSALGARRFIGRYPLAQPLILSTYWGGIGLIAASAHALPAAALQ